MPICFIGQILERAMVYGGWFYDMTGRFEEFQILLIEALRNKSGFAYRVGVVITCDCKYLLPQIIHFMINCSPQPMEI